MVRRRMQRGQRDFARTWNSNLRHQGFAQAAAEAIARHVPSPGDLTLAEFAATVNRIEARRVAKINRDPKKLFGAHHVPLPEGLLRYYHEQGITPGDALRAICDEVAREGEWEARVS